MSASEPPALVENAGRPADQSGRHRRAVVRAATFLSMATLILGLLHYYLGSRLISGSGLRADLALFAWIILWLLLLSIPIGFLSLRAMPGPLSRGLRAVSLFWIGAFWLLLTAVVFTDIARGLLELGWGRAVGHKWLAGPMQVAVVALLVLPAMVIGIRTVHRPARLERLTFPMPRLAGSFDGFRIVQISDLHITELLNKKFLQEVVDRVNSLQPDLIAITGDLIDGHVKELRPHVAALAQLRAHHGAFFVTGNHEYYFGAAEWEGEVARLGLTVLHNSHRVLRRGEDSLVVAGVTDHGGGQFDPTHEPRPDLALAGAPMNAARILLAHQPKTAEKAAGQSVDLQLSGHTHGGQIFPFMLIVRMAQPVVRGLRQLSGVWVYTNQGTGYWGPPMRVGTRGEITEITLTRGDSSSDGLAQSAVDRL